MKLMMMIALILGSVVEAQANDLEDWNGRAKSYYTCGCTSAELNSVEANNRDNWVFYNSITESRASANAKAGCAARYGQGTPLVGACKHVALLASEIARLRRRDSPETVLKPRRSRRNRGADEIDYRHGSAIDETIRRNREDELERVLRRARECEMYRNSVRVVPNSQCD